MISAGVDVGNQRVKVVVLGDGGILSYSVAHLGVDIKKSSQRALDEALKKAGVKRQDIGRTVTTGAGGKDVPFGDETFSMIYCDAVGATSLFPGEITGVDLGFEECRVFKCDPSGRLRDSDINEKCAAGTGAFIEVIAKALGVPPEEAGALSMEHGKELPLTTVCAVFGESEAISLVHRGEKVPDILRAVYSAVASKAVALLYKIAPNKGSDVLLIGGVAKNAGFVDCFKEMVGPDLVIPENPEIVGALGAALLGRNKTREGEQ